MSDLWLGIDIGTSAVKALAVDGVGAVCARAAAAYPTHYPAPGHVEQDAVDWWEALCAAVRGVGESVPLASVRALCLSTQGDTMVPLDAAGAPLAPARTWMDIRGADLVAELEGQVGAEAWHRLTGGRLGAYSAALSLAWWRRHLPQAFAAAERFALVHDYLAARLTGVPALDQSNACRTLVYDVTAREWSAPLLDAVGVGPARLSPVVPSGTPIGRLTPDAVTALGLPPEAILVAGGHDQVCAAVGAGAVSPGQTLLSCGTAWVLLAAQTTPAVNPALAGVQTYCHALPDCWALLAAHAGGNALSWLAHQFLGLGDPDYAALDAEAQAAAQSPAPPVLLLPQFYGTAEPAGLREARGALWGLNLSHTRGDLVLGVLRGVALEARRHVAFLRQAGASVSELRMIGGGASSALWPQIVADACNLPVALPPVTDAAPYGAALIAAGAVMGAPPPTPSATHRLVTPDPAGSAFLASLAGTYEDALLSLRPHWS